ncbi:MAG: hypothetical protein AAGJ93_00840 [Bacteroidota bacterium]
MIVLDTLNLMTDLVGLRLWQIIILGLVSILFLVVYIHMRVSRAYYSIEKDKRFRLEITSFENDAVRIGVFTSDELSGQGISDILSTALPVIGKKDPHLLRLLLFHCLEALETDEQIGVALVRFHEEIGQSLSDS